MHTLIIGKMKVRVRTLIIGKVKLCTLIMGKMKVRTLILALTNVSEPLLYNRIFTFHMRIRL